MKSLTILCIDHEGGRGGSSRSLHEFIAHLDRSALSIEVWCRRGGAIEQLYCALGVPCRVIPELPSYRAQERLRPTLADLARLARDLFRHWRLIRGLVAEIHRRFDVVHLNYETLGWLAVLLRRTGPVRIVMHMRYLQPQAAWFRIQAWILRRSLDRFVFIADTLRQRFLALGGGDGPVILNPVSFTSRSAPAPTLLADPRPKVAMIANFGLERGHVDLIAIAAALARRGRSDIVSVVAGDQTLPGGLPKPLDVYARAGRSFVDYVGDTPHADQFRFLGHVANPEAAIAASVAVLKLNRRGEPWGRDIIETMALARPVIATGEWTGFVEPGVTGYLVWPFDADVVADHIIRLVDDPELAQRMGEAGRERVSRLCDPKARAADLLAVWRQVAASA
ncbi:MAG: glycosyltransferase family 4 protein [Alphaproteobacteria bacterium]|nr:glycosyltransferase family 4 protein [Alphaproteobacteria bacterium]